MPASNLCLLVLCALAACTIGHVDPVEPPGSHVSALVEQADRQRRTGDQIAAETLYKKALDQEADARRAHVGIQEIMGARGRHLDLRRAYRAIGDPFLTARIEGSEKRRKEALRKAEEPYRTIGASDLAYSRGKFKHAESGFRRATRIDPGEPWAWIGLGRAQLALRKYGEAYETFRTATWSAPHHPTPWYGMSIAAQWLGRPREAFRTAAAALERAPTDASAIERMERASRRLRNPDDLRSGARHLSKAGEGRSADAMLASAGLYAAAGDTQDGQNALAKALRQGALQAELEAALPNPEDANLAEFLRRFSSGVSARYFHYRATREAESLTFFVSWARALYEETTGDTLGPAGKIEDFPFVGKLVDPTLTSDEPLVKKLAERGMLLVLGQRAGGPPEAILAVAVRRTPKEKIQSRGVEVEREAVWLGHRYISGYVEWAGGGDLAGLALGSIVLVDLHAAARWEGTMRRRLAKRRQYATEALAQQALDDKPVDSVDDPAGVADRLLLGSDDLDLAAEVLVHEDAHLIDAARFLPVGKNMLRGFGLALKHGFHAQKVVAYLERNAQLTAVAESKHPRAALAVCCRSLGGRGEHAIGYRDIVEGFVAVILLAPDKFPAIDTTRVVVQQLHLLTDAEIRAIARTLLSEWKLVRH
ncbi:MAG: tetratricopeptide repeat protein [Planctomycetota bacterium]